MKEFLIVRVKYTVNCSLIDSLSNQNNPPRSATDKPTSRDDHKNANELFSEFRCTSEIVRFGTQGYGNTSWAVSVRKILALKFCLTFHS